MDRTRYEPVCIAYDPPVGSHYEEALHKAGVPLLFLNKRRPFDIGVFLRLHRLFRLYQPAVVHMHISGLNYAYPLLWLHRTPVRVYTVHSIAEKDLHYRREGRLIQHLAFRMRWLGITPVAISALVKASFQHHYGFPDLPVIPNGIPVEEYTPDAARRAQWRLREGFPAEAILVVAVAGFRPEKNLSLLIEAFSGLLEVYPVHLLLVGSGEEEQSLRQLVAQRGQTHRIHFLGVRADIADILNAADIFALSSRWEGTPMAILEAMASGLPVVSTAVGGVPELVDDGRTGLLTPPEDANALRAALQTLTEQPALRAQMGEWARQKVKAQFNIRQTVRMYENLYEAIAQKQGG
jgi:glycosyltransferase involved in cell wall biosynthesis